MSAPALTNVRLITILAASLLAGYAGDEALNAWWRPANPAITATESAKMASNQGPALSAEKPIAN